MYNITPNLKKLASYASFEPFLKESESFYWAKGCKREGNVIIPQTCFLTCKDYLTDFQFKENTHTYKRTEWTPEEISENVYILVFPTEGYKIRFLSNIATYLHPLELKNRLKKTKVTDASVTGVTSRNTVVVEGSQQWSKNVTILSCYLSILRICASQEHLTSDNIGESERNNACSEFQYMKDLTPQQRTLVQHVFNNPRLLMTKMPATVRNTGFSTIRYESHGTSGIFHIVKAQWSKGTHYWYDKLNVEGITKAPMKKPAAQAPVEW